MTVGIKVNTRIALALSGFIILGSFVGCAFVDVTKEAESVAVFKTLQEASSCEKRHEIGTQTKSKVGLMNRNKATVALELERLARNDAARLGANTIVPLGPVGAEGTRRYAAFVCPE